MTDFPGLKNIALVLALLVWSAPAVAEPPINDEDVPEHVEDAPVDDEDVDESTSDPDVAPDSPSPPVLPDDPGTRLKMAEQAFHNAEFELLRPLLEPLLDSSADLGDRPLRLRARQLLGVGLFFEAQQVAGAEDRRDLLRQARHRFLELLREEPDHSLDPMIFPASVVELFEEVRQENLEELTAIIVSRQQDPATQHRDMQTLYIERELRSNYLVLNFFPLGMGQFQNGSPVKGTLFAVAQVSALAVNILSYYMIERLRGPAGRFDTGPDGFGGDYQSALGWQNAQFGALGFFAAFYGWSILDGLMNFEPFYVHIRTLDGPPPELSPTTSSQPKDHGLGWSLRFRW